MAHLNFRLNQLLSKHQSTQGKHTSMSSAKEAFFGFVHVVLSIFERKITHVGQI